MNVCLYACKHVYMYMCTCRATLFVKALIIHARLRAACMIKRLTDCMNCGLYIGQALDHTCSLASGVYDQTPDGLYELWFIHLVRTLIIQARLRAACMIKPLTDCMNCGLYSRQDLDHTCSLASGVYDQTSEGLYELWFIHLSGP